MISTILLLDLQNLGKLQIDYFTNHLFFIYSIFLPVVDIQALMKHYNVAARSDPKDRLIDYVAFGKGLRRPLEGRRLGITESAWKKAAGDECVMTVAQAKANLAENFFEGWCSYHGVKEGDVVS